MRRQGTALRSRPAHGKRMAGAKALFILSHAPDRPEDRSLPSRSARDVVGRDGTPQPSGAWEANGWREGTFHSPPCAGPPGGSVPALALRAGCCWQGRHFAAVRRMGCEWMARKRFSFSPHARGPPGGSVPALALRAVLSWLFKRRGRRGEFFRGPFSGNAAPAPRIRRRGR
jgi:hypothetical protein